MGDGRLRMWFLGGEIDRVLITFGGNLVGCVCVGLFKLSSFSALKTIKTGLCSARAVF
jgi:hypothetical protein